jgi:DNA invertase Pin-like site-specific DNA recombinase
MTRQPVAYLRRSVASTTSPGTISQDVQLAKVREMAGAGVMILQDWGKSGRGSKVGARTEYQRLLDMIARDEVSTVYSYNLSRLGRSLRDVLSLVELCREHDTAIALADGLPVDPTAAVGRLIVQLFAAINEFQAELLAESAADNRAAWRAANPDAHEGRYAYGEDPERPDEDLMAVLAAFDKAGSFLGAAKRLTKTGVPTRLGKPWDTKSVSRIVRRARPDLRVNGRRGASAKAPRLFTGLLRCQCGQILTSMPRADASVGYYCRTAHLDSGHSRPYMVAETKIRAWAEDTLVDMRRIVIERGTLPDAGAIQARLAQLDAKRARYVEMYADGTITKAERDRRIALIAADRVKAQASLDVRGAGTLFLRPQVDWAADPATINDQLRQVWSAILLNGGMLPKRALWVPCEEWNEEGPLS